MKEDRETPVGFRFHRERQIITRPSGGLQGEVRRREREREGEREREKDREVVKIGREGEISADLVGQQVP